MPECRNVPALVALMGALLTVGVLSMVHRSPAPQAAVQNGPRVVAAMPAAGPSIAHAERVNVSAKPLQAMTARPADLTRHAEAEYPALEGVYKHLHANPELSYQEVRTAAYLAKQLNGTGFEVTRHFAGNGVVAVLRNGPGPTVLVRTEMDALPVTENTGLPYASKARAETKGGMVGVMHACGHDVHMTCWVGTARMLAAARDRWHGTLVFIAQPAEEVGGGAEDMLKAGLFTRFPRPDFCLALHCDPEQPCGHVAFTPGLAMANIDMVDITVRGKGGHGAWPHMTVDPVVLAARLVLDLQTLVSRENNPTDPLVLTVGTIHGGVKANVIPNEVKLQLTVRTTKELSRKRVLDGILRMAKAAAAGAGAPEPVVNLRRNWYTPAVVNDAALMETTVGAFRGLLGPDRVHQRPPMMGGEDFALYGRAGVPSFLYFLGTQEPARIAQAQVEDEQVLPSLHSDRFAPVMEPTIKTGVQTMTLAVLNLVGREAPLVAAASPSRPAGGRAARPGMTVFAAAGKGAGASQVR